MSKKSIILDMLAQGADYQSIVEESGSTIESVRWYASKYGYTKKSKRPKAGESKSKASKSKPDVFSAVMGKSKPRSKKQKYEAIISIQKKMIREYAKTIRQLESQL